MDALNLHGLRHRPIDVAVEDDVELFDDVLGEAGELGFVADGQENPERAVFQGELEHLGDRWRRFDVALDGQVAEDDGSSLDPALAGC